MADNVDITAGSGTTVAADERTINSVSVKIQRVDEIGASSTAAGQVDVTNSTTQIVAARETRKRLIIVNRQNVAVYVGPNSATTSMFRLDPGDSVTLHTTARVDGITSAAHTASGDEQVHYLEEYDS